MLSILGGAKTLEVSRLRIGVGAAPREDGMVSWVLGSFSPPERAELPSLLDKVGDAAEFWRAKGAEEAMNKINGSD